MVNFTVENLVEDKASVEKFVVDMENIVVDMENSQVDKVEENFEAEEPANLTFDDYEAMDDNELVRLAQQKDNIAWYVLFKKYKPALKKKANQSHLKHREISEDDFYEKYLRVFELAVEGYDLKTGTFSGFLFRTKLGQATHIVLQKLYRSKVRDEDGNRVKKSEFMIHMDEETMDSQLDVAYEDKNSGEPNNEAETDLYQYIASKSVQDAKVANLRAQGYKFEEIASIMGHTGSPEAKRNWTKRSLERSQKYAREFYEKNRLNLSLKK